MPFFFGSRADSRMSATSWSSSSSVITEFLFTNSVDCASIFAVLGDASSICCMRFCAPIRIDRKRSSTVDRLAKGHRAFCGSEVAARLPFPCCRHHRAASSHCLALSSWSTLAADSCVAAPWLCVAILCLKKARRNFRSDRLISNSASPGSWPAHAQHSGLSRLIIRKRTACSRGGPP